MSYPFVRIPHTRQPQYAARVNRSNPRARGLVFFAPLSPTHGLRDLAKGSRGTPTGMGTVNTDGKSGRHFLLGSGNYIDFTVPPEIASTTPFTIAWTQYPIGTSAYSTVVNVNFGSGTNSFLIYLDAVGGGSYRFCCGPRNGGNIPTFATSVGAPTNYRLDRFVLTVAAGSQNATAANYILWRNGVRYTTSTVVAIGANTASGFRIGSLLAAGDYFEGLIGDMRLWSRVLTDNEAFDESLYEKAFDLYEPIPALYLDTVAGGGGSLIKTINGLPIASVKTLNGLAIASVKTRNGLTNV